MPSLLQLQIGFEFRIYSRDDVGTWVDQEIMKSERPCAELLELTCLTRLCDHDVVSLLASLGPDPAPEERVRMELAAIAHVYRHGRISLEQAIARMFHFAMDRAGLSEDEVATLYRLDDEIEYVVRAEVCATFAAFITRFPEFPALASPRCPHGREANES
jgi:hypothetical protein